MADAPSRSPVDVDRDGSAAPAGGLEAVSKTEPVPAATTVTEVDAAGVDEPSVSHVGASASRRMRARLVRLGAQRSSVNPVLEPLFRIVRTTHPKADLRLIERAYDVAERHHRGQLRKSGDPFITHPLAVTTILAELGMTPPTLCAALLHDTVEDTTYTLDQLRKEFGDEVARLVDGVTKLDKVKYGESAQAETVRKMVVAMARDIRVLVIKLADRLHNMRTLRYLPAAKQEQKARETLEIFAPLAHRLGMNTIKWELEDLSFATLYPKVYDEIVRLVSDRSPSRDEYLSSVIDHVTHDLRDAKIRAAVTGRPKHYYSIYQKMIVRGRDFADIYDLVGIRVLVDSVRDCYAALGSVHARWNPVPGRFKDYIAMPKFNMYQSLHTTVIGPEGKPVELQIRTFEMHKRAEYGIAAHWKYKEGGAPPGAGKPGDDMA
ncbi:MAG: diphosphokinase / guanosine-3,5-bis(diphosphate) 3-diphosphatase, partial [Actinomycetota bacterium]|nr:diphosphokinase / guanosine-3,5-bis(diphosphate) 3-diphosphatase [Actinomycetota bacterium]